GPVWLLKTRVAMKPVGACLLDREFIGERFTRLDARETDTWHTVLIERQDQTVPVNGRHLIQVVGHIDLDGFTLLEAHHRARRCTVMANTFFHESAGISRYPGDRKVVLTGQNHGWHQQAEKPRQPAWFHLCCSELHVIEAGPR